METFRRTLFVCAVAGLGAASGCTQLPLLEPSKDNLSPPRVAGRPAPPASLVPAPNVQWLTVGMEPLPPSSGPLPQNSAKLAPEVKPDANPLAQPAPGAGVLLTKAETLPTIAPERGAVPVGPGPLAPLAPPAPLPVQPEPEIVWLPARLPMVVVEPGE